MLDILRKQQNILYLSSSQSYGTKERMILRDAKILKDIGHYVFIYCMKNSLLDIKAREFGFDCLYHNAGEHIKFIKWYKLSSLKDCIERYDINIVHCYELNYVWPTAFFLRKKNKTSLFFTVSEDVVKYYKKFWFKSLMSRVDMVYVPLKEMNESISDHLDVPKRKIFFSGLGLDVDSKTKPIKLDENVWNLAIYVNEDLLEVDDIETCIQSIWSLNQKRSLSKTCVLHLFSAKGWDDNVLKPEIVETVKKYGLSQNVIFHEHVKLAEINADIFLSYATGLPLEDYTLGALLKGIPIITDRNPATEELAISYGRAVMTYKTNDSRELRCKIEETFENYESAKDEVSRIKTPILNEHGLDFYRTSLIKNYEKQLNKRWRFFH